MSEPKEVVQLLTNRKNQNKDQQGEVEGCYVETATGRRRRMRMRRTRNSQERCNKRDRDTERHKIHV